MGSGASVSEGSRPERPEATEDEPGRRRASTPAGRSDATLQADEDAAKPESSTVDIQSLKSVDRNVQMKEEEEEEEEEEEAPVTEAATEGGEVSLDFESFLHDNGTLYSCFSHHGNRVYVDESQNLQPFPEDWYSQGRFVNASSEVRLFMDTFTTNELNL
ncbi:uncharacterized protein LOC143321766 [Chaetodon auriga]|uniref:uncharacterized protein LOC143321766 n=1 Tax=Chaetodon auriga TaxID=39042 RepID=UPI004032ACC2